MLEDSKRWSFSDQHTQDFNGSWSTSKILECKFKIVLGTWTCIGLTFLHNACFLLQVLCSAWKDDGSTVFSGGCDKIVKMWPLFSGGQSVTVAMHDGPIKEIAWIDKMNLLVTGSWDKTLKYVIYVFPLYLH